MKHIISVDDLTSQDLESFFSRARSWKGGGWPATVTKPERQRILVNLFFEPSTRTSSSFESAAYRLGHKVISIKDMSSTSVTKGESFEDTIRAYSSYGDVLVLRHPDSGAALRASEVSSIPVINAGDGTNEHPTQAFLDLFTIQDRLGDRISFSNREDSKLGETDLTLTFCGDLKYGRTVHSLAKLMARFEGVTINYVALPKYQIKDSFMENLGVSQTKYLPQRGNSDPIDFDSHTEEDLGRILKERLSKASFEWSPALTPDILEKTDVLYMTRVQKERVTKIRKTSRVYGPTSTNFPRLPTPEPSVLTPDLVSSMPDKSIIMHPFPRVDEIDPAIDGDPRVAYFDQMKNGVFVRASLLSYICP